jgi:hypothetical protein
MIKINNQRGHSLRGHSLATKLVVFGAASVAALAISAGPAQAQPMDNEGCPPNAAWSREMVWQLISNGQATPEVEAFDVNGDGAICIRAINGEGGDPAFTEPTAAKDNDKVVAVAKIK